MEVDGLPLVPHEKTGYTVSGTAFSPNTERQYSNKRTKGLSEPDTSPTAPKERASILQYQHYVKETIQTLQQPDHIHTQIVDSFGISIKGKDFATLQAKEMLSDGIVDWMCQFWTTQVGGSIGAKAGIGQPRIVPHLPRCYYVSSRWFSKLTEDGWANHQKVARWTLGVNVFQDYDVMLIPIIHNYHWYLGNRFY
jgi:Ulp1 family protease